MKTRYKSGIDEKNNISYYKNKNLRNNQNSNNTKINNFYIEMKNKNIIKNNNFRNNQNYVISDNKKLNIYYIPLIGTLLINFIILSLFTIFIYFIGDDGEYFLFLIIDLILFYGLLHFSILYLFYKINNKKIKNNSIFIRYIKKYPYQLKYIIINNKNEK